MTFTRRIIRTLFLCTTLTLLVVASFGQNPDGDPIGPGNEINDQRTGSLLIYNYYTSNTSAAQNTLISMTNTNTAVGVNVRLSFVNGVNGQISYSGLTFAPGQTTTFLMSDVDPGTTGYLIANALSDFGAPLQFDYLMGLATITLASGHQATLGALAVPTNANGSYAALPRQLALDQVPSPQASVERMLIINRIDGDLTSGMPAIGSLQTEFFNDQGKRLLFNSANQGPQAKIFVNNLFNYQVYWPRFLPVGRYGWLRLRPAGAGAITGAVLYFNRNPFNLVTSPAPGSYNLRHLTNTPATVQSFGGELLFGY